MVTASQQNVWVDAVRKGKGSLEANALQYRVQGLLGPQSNALLYGVGSAMTLQKQDFQGLKDAYIYNVKEEKFVEVNSMNYARWYPTLAEMGNGMVMAMSGLNGAGQVTMNTESYNPANGTWTSLGAHGFPTYPATFLTENGQLFFTGSNSGYGPSTAAWRTPGFYNVWTNAFTPVPGIKDPQDLETSASVLLPPAQNQKIMVLGGGGVGQSNSSTARTALIDVAAPNPQWVTGPSLAEPTRYPITVLLPSDQVLVTGGSTYYRGMHGSDNRDTRIYNVASNTFSWAANSITGRDYHSGGILLPNGSILTLGGNPLFGNKQDTEPQTFNQEIDVYYPPYMFQGNRPAHPVGAVGHEPGRQLPHQGVRPVQRPVPAADAAGQSHPRDRRQRAFGRGQLHPGRPRLPADQHPGQREHHPAELLHAVRGERQGRAVHGLLGSGALTSPPGLPGRPLARSTRRRGGCLPVPAPRSSRRAMGPQFHRTRKERTRMPTPRRPLRRSWRTCVLAVLATAIVLCAAACGADPYVSSARLYTFPGSPLLSAATFLKANGQPGRRGGAGGPRGNPIRDLGGRGAR